MITNPTTRRGLFAIAGLFVPTAILFLVFPEIDLRVEALFADGTNGFPLRIHPIAKWFNAFINNLAAFIILLSLCGLLITSKTKAPFGGLWRRQHGFLQASILLGPGLIANFIFKEHWGRARPRQIIEFGGSQEFSPPLLMADQCATNCSFVSGDAAMAFAMLAVAFLVTRFRKTAVVFALAFGLFIGFIRMIQGAHFLSDVLFAGLFVTAAILLLKATMLDTWTKPPHTPWLLRTLVPKHGKDAPPKALIQGPEKTPSRGKIWLFFRAKPEDFGL